MNLFVSFTAVANVVKTSLGPRGLDKLIVQPKGDVLITNDGATILKELEATHPCAKMVCEHMLGVCNPMAAIIQPLFEVGLPFVVSRKERYLVGPSCGTRARYEL